MRYIGIIPADRLPSSSIGLRAMEFNRLKFSRVIAYTTSRATVARQYQNVEVAKTPAELCNLLASEPGESVAYVNGYFKVDEEAMRVFGVPEDNEIRCLAGQLFAGSTPLGDKKLLKVMEYDRRRNVSRYTKGDSGDIRVDVADMRGPVVMDANCLKGMMATGDEWMKTIGGFQDAVEAVGASVLCMDPMKHGVRWHPGIIANEKKPTSIVMRGSLVRDKKEEPIEKAKAEEVHVQLPQTEDTWPPVLTVAFFTHNRTKTAMFCLDSICKRLKYEGKIRYCICDDRSDDGHVEALEAVLKDNGVEDYAVERTTSLRWGLGASMNNGLRNAFSVSPVVLTTEDDWDLQRELDVTSYVRDVMYNNAIGMIRLAACLHTHVTPYDENYWMMFGRKNDGHTSVLNNQVALRHRRLHELVGFYPENAKPDSCELRLRDKFNRETDFGWEKMRILFPRGLALHTLDDPSLYFIHIGESTVGHDHYTVPDRYVKGQDPIEICMIGDRGYQNVLRVLIENIKEIEPRKVNIRIIGWNFSNEDIELFKKHSDGNVTVYAVNVTSYYTGKCLEIGGYKREQGRYTVPPTGLLKFYLPEILDGLDKTLYIDGDILVRKPLGELFDTDISSVYCAAVPDIGSVTMVGAERFKIMQGDSSYFNSGVLLLNLKLLREDNVPQYLYEIKKNLTDRSLMDQDALNIGFRGKTKLLPCKYNYLRGIDTSAMNGKIGVSKVNKLYGTNYATIEAASEDAVIYHFAGPTKPWRPMLPEWRLS